MGGSQSVEDANKDIRKFHRENSIIYNNILQRGKKIVNEITEAGYDDKGVCDRLGYHYVDKLNSFFDVVVMKGVADKIQLGLVPEEKEETEGMENYKKKLCTKIVDFHMTKIKAIQNIREKLPLCLEKEKKVFEVLSKLSKETDINTENWMSVYKKLKQFNSTIKSKYSNIDNMVEKIRKANTEPKLTRAINEANSVLNSANTVCEKYETELTTATKTLKRSIPTKVTRTAASQSNEIVVGSVVQTNRDLVYNMDGAIIGTLENAAKETIPQGTWGIVKKIDKGWAYVSGGGTEGAVRLTDLDLVK